MKIMNKVLILAGIAAALMVNVDCVAKRIKRATSLVKKETQPVVVEDAVVEEATEEVRAATAKAQVAISDIEQKIADIRGQLAKGEISPVDAAKKIGEYNYTIEQEKKQLAELVGKEVNKVEGEEAQESYVSRFVSGVKDLGTRIVAPFKAGYGYSEKEQAIARAVIAELQDQLESIKKGYALVKERAATPEEKNQMMREYDAVIQEIETEIRNQQVITGEVVSRNRKLFWAAVGTAGAVAAGAAAQYYLTPGANVTDVTTDMGSTTELGLPMEPASNQTQTLSEFLISREPTGDQIQTPQTPINELVPSTDQISENSNIQDLDFEQNVGTPEAREELRSMVKETAQQGASVGASLAEQAKQNVGEELAARRHHPSPLTPRQAWDKASSWVSEKAENVKDALFGSSVPSDAEAAEEYFVQYGPQVAEVETVVEPTEQIAQQEVIPAFEETVSIEPAEGYVSAGYASAAKRAGSAAAGRSREIYSRVRPSIFADGAGEETTPLEPAEDTSSITEEMARNREAAQERLRASQERKAQQQRRQPAGWQ